MTQVAAFTGASGLDRPVKLLRTTEEEELRRWQRLVVILAVASIAMGLALSILAVFLVNRHAALSVEETKLLSLLPEGIRGTCDHLVHPADTDVEGNPLMDGGVVGVLCSAGKGKGWIYLRFELFENEESMNYVFSHLNTPPENRCMSRGPGKAPGVAEAWYFSQGERIGHILCIRNNGGQPEIEWTDDRDLVFGDALAYPGLKRHPAEKLYQWWRGLGIGQIVYRES